MPVVVVGLNESDAPLELLELIAVSDRDLAKALVEVGASPHVSEVVILSTCLRTEVYAVVGRFHDGVADIEEFFRSRLATTARTADQTRARGATPGSPDKFAEPDSLVELLSEHLVVAYEEAAAEHLFEVAAGIDSAVLGEGEILRQVRRAEERARSERASGPVLNRLFRHAVATGKRARAETGIARGVTSLAHVAVGLALEASGGSLANRNAVVVGAGEMGSGIANALARIPVPPNIVVVNRGRTRAANLAAACGGSAVALSRLHEALADADLVIAATAADEVILTLEDIQRALADRPGRQLVIVDAAVPRDVDPAVRALGNVRLFDLDDLRTHADAEMDARRAEVEKVRSLVVQELVRYREDALGRAVAPVVTALRSQAERLVRAELERSAAWLGRLDPEDGQAVEHLVRGIVAKLIHEPTVEVKRASGTPEGERLAEALRTLFGL